HHSPTAETQATSDEGLRHYAKTNGWFRLQAAGNADPKNRTKADGSPWDPYDIPEGKRATLSSWVTARGTRVGPCYSYWDSTTFVPGVTWVTVKNKTEKGDHWLRDYILVTSTYRTQGLGASVRLNDGRVEAANDLNFVICQLVKRPKKKKVKSTPVSWETMFKELKEYKRVHGTCKVPQKNGKLGTWVKNQRSAKRGPKQGTDRYNLLDGIGFWD
ncbi:hypothetical protein THAOC_10660, partial [Thalassiosira oceanica]